ncbi:Os01g0649732, partial [Oryza sativa Japonica Group]
TDEVDDEAAVGGAAGGAVEEGLAVGWPQRGPAGVVAVEESDVAGVCKRVPEAEHARVARRRQRPRRTADGGARGRAAGGGRRRCGDGRAEATAAVVAGAAHRGGGGCGRGACGRVRGRSG